MDYRIHHLDLVEAPDQRFIFEEEIRKNIDSLQEILYQYAIKPVLHIFIKKETALNYIIYASLQLKRKDLLIKEEGTKAATLVHDMLDKLIFQVKETLEFKKT